MVSVLLGNGNGTFQAAKNFFTSTPITTTGLAFSVKVADLNGDGRPDLAVADYNGEVSVLLGNGNGTFKAAKVFSAGPYPISLAVADLNGDGLPDLVLANHRVDNTVSVLLGKRNAATHLQITAPATVTAGTPFTITVTALTAGKQIDDLYTGTVTFTSGDGMAVLPANYTFTGADLGVHTFTVTLETTGSQTVTATDTVHGRITGTATVTVNAAAAPPSRAATPSGRTAAAPPGAADLANALAAHARLLLAGAGVAVDGRADPEGTGSLRSMSRVQPGEIGAVLGMAVVPPAGIFAPLGAHAAHRRVIDYAFTDPDGDLFGDFLATEERSGMA
jgi:hypothetical protein